MDELAHRNGGAASPSVPLKLGASKRFDTWTGYEVGKFPKAVVSADPNGGGAPDLGYARDHLPVASNGPHWGCQCWQ